MRQAHISSDTHSVLFCTRNLSIICGRSIESRNLDEIFGAFVAIRNASDPRLGLFATRFADLDLILTSLSFSHFPYVP